jgi:hypothetical protein
VLANAQSWLNQATSGLDSAATLQVNDPMNLLPYFKLVTPATLCAFLVGCASVDTGPPTVVRTPAPKNYEKTITDYLAFRIRTPQKNAEVSFGAPEPGACALDGYATSSRGWVVPVAYVTRSGEVTGRDTIRINAKQYYFWFLGNTIAGITPRIELCPGVGTGFESPAPNPAASPLSTTAFPVRASGEAQGREQADAAAESLKRDRAQESAKAVSGDKKKGATATKKTGAPPGKARSAAKNKSADTSTKSKPT